MRLTSETYDSDRSNFINPLVLDLTEIEDPSAEAAELDVHGRQNRT